MKMMIHDFETMGQKAASCVVVNCAYYVFDFDRFTSDDPYLLKDLISEIKRDKFEIKHQLKFGYKIEKSAIEFWSNLPKEVRKQTTPSDEDITIQDFIENLIQYTKNKKIGYCWSRSNTFDPIILNRIAETCDRDGDLNDILKFWKVRDIRTFIDSKTNFQFFKNGFTPVKDQKMWDSIFKEHDSVHDVAADILRLQTLVRLDNDLEIPE